MATTLPVVQITAQQSFDALKDTFGSACVTSNAVYSLEKPLWNAAAVKSDVLTCFVPMPLQVMEGEGKDLYSPNIHTVLYENKLHIGKLKQHTLNFKRTVAEKKKKKHQKTRPMQ
jgi:hypothetical protein